LEATDLSVSEVVAGRERQLEVAELSRQGEEWEVVVLFDLEFSDSETIRASAASIARQTDRLLGLGDVSVVTQRDGIQIRTPVTDDASVVRDALSWIELQERGDDVQFSLDPNPDAAVQTGSAEEASQRAVASAGAENARVTRMLDRLSLWIADREPSSKPRLLVWANSGLDLSGSEKRAIAAERSSSDALDDLRALLLSEGWTTLSIGIREELPESLADLGSSVPDAATLDAMRPAEERQADALVRSDLIADRLKKRSALKARSGERREAIDRVAEATGGRSVLEADLLKPAIAELEDRWTVRLASTVSPSGVLAVDWSEAGKKKFRGSSLTGIPELPRGDRPSFLSEVRLRDYLGGEVSSGNLSFSAVVEKTGAGAELLVQLEVDEVGELPASIAVAAALDGVEPVAVQRTIIAAGNEPGVQVRSLFAVDLPGLRLQDGDEDRLIVVLEDRRTGDWGVEYATVLDGPDESTSEELSLFLPAPKSVQLLAPSAALVAGKTTFETVIADRSIDTVEFFVDGKRFASVRKPPFRATADLGRLPELRDIEVVAYRGGAEVGRDLLRVNEGSGGFRVQITRPTVAAAEKMTGPVSIAADVEAPRGVRVERVEYYWNESLIASRLDEPWVERVLIPSDEPSGFVRVVAHLEDGTLSEDVLFFNSPGSTERLDVNLVELYVVVSDRNGAPVQGLDKSDFEIEEDGATQSIATFSDAGNLPLTLGLAIDSSASMFIKLPKVQEAAAGFLNGLSPDRDRAFLVGFGDEPTIHRDTTTQVDRVVRALDRLQPDGQTGIWKGIVYSLVQLQGVPGRKALVVYSDGADEDADFSYRTCLQFARKIGVPIYVILSNNEIVRTGGKSLKVAGFLDRLERMTREVGGRVFLTRVGDDMNAVYEQIEEEIRSQYLIGYYSEFGEADRWRKVEVDVAGGRGYRSRTVSGVFR